MLFGSILLAVTLGYIAALHLNAHASLLRKLFASLVFAGSFVAATAAGMLGFGAISSLAAARTGILEPLAALALALAALAMLLGGCSVFLLRGAGRDSQTAERPSAMHSLGSRLQAVFVVCLFGVGTGVLILEVPPLWSTFPEISDWNSLRITLERGGCLGTCPIYKVAIRGDGTVTYDGTQFVAVIGRQEDHIPVPAVHELFEQFRKANYFAYSDVYAIIGFDFPTYTTSIAFDGRSKSVRNFAGPRVGMPREVTDLENAIDRAANTDKWIKGS